VPTTCWSAATKALRSSPILFDFDKDVIKPESKPALDEIAALLNGKPDLKVKIVGHTDNQGTDE